MRPTARLRLITENLPEQRFLEAIFRPEIERGAVQVDSALTASAATGIAEYSLLSYPGRPVALVLNAGGRYPLTDEDLEATIRILSKASRSDWCFVPADPDVDAWVMADPRVRAGFESDETTRNNLHERAARIGDLARARPIDRAAIGRSHPSFRDLDNFIKQHTSALQPTT